MPRRLNKYINCRLDDVNEIYIVDYCDNRFDIPKNEYEDVFKIIKQIKVQPLASPLKTFTEYSLYIKSSENVCKIKNLNQFEELINQYIKKAEE